MNVIRSPILISAVLLSAMVVSWSSGFIGYRYVADQGSVYLASVWRFILAAAVLLPFAWAGLRTLHARDVAHQALLGLFAIGGYIGPIAASIQLGVAPGTASLLANLLPLTIVVLAVNVPGQRTRGWQWVGLGLCLTGMLVASGANVEWDATDLWVFSLPLLAVLSLAAATLYQKASPGALMPASSALFIQVCAVIPLFAVLACLEGAILPPTSAGFAGGVVWLVVFSTGRLWILLAVPAAFQHPTHQRCAVPDAPGDPAVGMAAIRRSADRECTGGRRVDPVGTAIAWDEHCEGAGDNRPTAVARDLMRK